MAWTEEEVLLNKNNMMIAKFMGAEILSPNSKFSYVQYPMDAWVTDIGAHKETYKQKLHSKNLEYHESWNWIMPVVQTINIMDDYRYTIQIDSMDVRIHDNKNGGYIFVSECKWQPNELINAVYEAVLEFLKIKTYGN